ncbi:MAG TPA: hypothetical protein VN821_04340 [Candidatus Udaeobacter sp.]|nr:hypothetical protein [Candidatus Udaeobacter sp.]
MRANGVALLDPGQEPDLFEAIGLGEAMEKEVILLLRHAEVGDKSSERAALDGTP